MIVLKVKACTRFRQVRMRECSMTGSSAEGSPSCRRAAIWGKGGGGLERKREPFVPAAEVNV